jgi:hypothetical protein
MTAVSCQGGQATVDTRIVFSPMEWDCLSASQDIFNRNVTHKFAILLL